MEIGAGPRPTPGYVHVDADRRARHVEHLAPAWKLPFPDHSLQELLAIHVLENVHPTRVGETLVEWRRVLRPGGVAHVQVYDAARIFRAFLGGSTDLKWLLLSAIFGFVSPYGGPTEPRRASAYDFDLLRDFLLAAGFESVTNLTDPEPGGRIEDWAVLTSRLDLVVAATAGHASA